MSGCRLLELPASAPAPPIRVRLPAGWPTESPPPARGRLALAATGFGKTTSLVRPNILLHAGSVLALDVKGEICAADAACLAAAGRPVAVFDPEAVIEQLPAGAERVGLDLVSGWQSTPGDWRLRLVDALTAIWRVCPGPGKGRKTGLSGRPFRLKKGYWWAKHREWRWFDL